MGESGGSMMVSANDVAAELRKRLPGVGPVRLHKLLYYCQGWHLAWTGKPLFAETVQAWANGPVVGTLWAAEKHGWQPPAPSILPDDGLSVIGYVISRYGGMTAAELIRLTHDEAPWREVTECDVPDGWNDQEISCEALATFFRADAEQERLARLAKAAYDDPDARRALTAKHDGPAVADDPAEVERRISELAS
jgi:uncharacterized phage-associated protein